MKKMRKIIFVSHDSSYTGAPLLLLQLMKWIKSTKECSFQIILLQDGLLRGDFFKLGKVLIINPTGRKYISFLIHLIKIFIPFFYRAINNFRIRRFVNSFHPDLIYVNSVMSLKLILELKKTGNYPVLCHVHELEYGIDHYLGSSTFSSIIHLIDRFIANSNATKNNLIHRYLIPAEKINIIQPHVQITNQNNNKQNIFKELSIDQDTFIVVGCGIDDWRKGTDLFIYTAFELLKKTEKKFNFYWIGERDEKQNRQLSYEINTLGLSDKVKLLGFRNNASDYFECADVFFMSSREESFGMVGLESALKGVPIICFDTSLGMKEFINNDAGFVVPYPDYKAAAEKILELMNNPTLKKDFGNKGRERALEEANIEITGPKIWTVIEDTLE